jgi:8-oxo-dGTP pyrophosphatase MutT (NUDIX family)
LDFYRDKHPKLPALNFKQFAEIIFNECPLLQRYKHLVHEIRSTWVQYKTSVPVCGAIILNKSMDRALLVRGIGSGASWSFPRGKINKDEPSTTCAIREVREETGLDISHLIHENDFIELTFNEQTVKLFLIVLDCHESELPPFAPQTRGEIGDIQWLHLDEDILHAGTDKKKKRFWSVVPFVRQSKQWINNKRRTSTSPTNSPTSAKPRTPKQKPSKRSGKNARRMTDSEIDYQIPTPRIAPKAKPSIVKSQPITILRRGDALSQATNSVGTVPSSYTPPSFMASPESQFFAFSPSPSTPPQPQYSQMSGHNSHSYPVKPSSYPSFVEMHTKHATSDSFLNFTFNADDIVGDVALVV